MEIKEIKCTNTAQKKIQKKVAEYEKAGTLVNEFLELCAQQGLEPHIAEDAIKHPGAPFKIVLYSWAVTHGGKEMDAKFESWHTPLPHSENGIKNFRKFIKEIKEILNV